MKNSDFPLILSWNTSIANIVGMLTIINVPFLRIEDFQVVVQSIGDIVCRLSDST